MAARTLVLAILLASGARAEDVTPSAQPIRETLAAIQRAVAQARDERHPVKLTCAVQAEDEVASLIERRDSDKAEASRQALSTETTMKQCIASSEWKDAGLSDGVHATPQQLALFSEPPAASFNPPAR